MGFTYKHVILVGIDGAGSFYKKTDAPAIRRLFADGAGTDRCLTSIPTISAECWGSMLIGVGPEIHGLTNDILSNRPYENGAHPTVFKRIRQAMPDADLAAFCNWSPINSGIVERGLGVYLDTGEDGALCDRICEYIKAKKPTFLFVQFDAVDSAGHTFVISRPSAKRTVTSDGSAKPSKKRVSPTIPCSSRPPTTEERDRITAETPTVKNTFSLPPWERRYRAELKSI